MAVHTTELTKQAQYDAQVSLMFFLIYGKDEDVIKVDQHKLIQVRPEDIVHEALECRWRIGKTKTQHTPLIMPVWSTECSFLNIIACRNLSNKSSIRGNGYLFFTVTLLRAR